MFRVEERFRANAMRERRRTRKRVECRMGKGNSGKIQMVICIRNRVWIVL